MAAYLLCSPRSTAEEQPKHVPVLEAHVGGAESNHAAAAADRDRCTAVDMPEGDPPETLSARQAYGNPPYRGPGAGRQAAAQGARGERAPPARPATSPLTYATGGLALAPSILPIAAVLEQCV